MCQERESREKRLIAFISAMMVPRETAEGVISRCKAEGIKVLAECSLFASEYNRFDNVDRLVLNKSEVTLSSFPDNLKRGCLLLVCISACLPCPRNTPI